MLNNCTANIDRKKKRVEGRQPTCISKMRVEISASSIESSLILADRASKCNSLVITQETKEKKKKGNEPFYISEFFWSKAQNKEGALERDPCGVRGQAHSPLFAAVRVLGLP